MNSVGRSLVAVLAICALGSPAFADDDSEQKDRAAAHYKLGVELASKRKFRAALDEFREAYRVLPRYHVLFNIGELERELDHPAEALNAYRAFLQQGGRHVTAEQRGVVEEHLGELAARVADVNILVEGGAADLALDGKPLPRAPLDGPLAMLPGRHVLRATREDDRDEIDLDLTAGERRSVTLTPRPKSQPAPVEQERRPVISKSEEHEPPPLRRTPAWYHSRVTGGLLTGAAVIALAIGVTFVELAAHDMDVNSMGQSLLTLDEFKTRESLRAPGWVLLAAGGLLGIGAVLVFALPVPSTEVSLRVGPSQIGLAVRF